MLYQLIFFIIFKKIVIIFERLLEMSDICYIMLKTIMIVFFGKSYISCVTAYYLKDKISGLINIKDAGSIEFCYHFLNIPQKISHLKETR